MYPHEITTSSVWIRHNLPLSPSPPPNGDDKLRKQIRSQLVKSTDEIIEQHVRQERYRLDLKWCLDQYFGWNVPDPYLGQLVTANILGLVHLAYIIDINPENVMIIPADMLGSSVAVRFDDIYSAEDGPFYENFLLNHRVLHPQHVLDYIAHQKHKQELIGVNHNNSFGVIIAEPMGGNFEIEWPAGKETWFVHDEKPQRTQFVECRNQVMVTTSIFNIVEHLMQQTSPDCDRAVSLFEQQQNEMILVIQQLLAKQDALLEQNKLLKEEFAKQKCTLHKLVLIMEAIKTNEMPYETIDTLLDVKEQPVEQLQFQQTDQCIKYSPFFEFNSQNVSNCIDDFYNERGHSNTKTFSLKSITISSSNSFNTCIVQLISVGIILITCIFVSVTFRFLNSYMNFYDGTNTSYFLDDVFLSGTNDLEWFRTLAVP